jgi:hypothetical protein
VSVSKDKYKIVITDINNIFNSNKLNPTQRISISFNYIRIMLEDIIKNNPDKFDVIMKTLNDSVDVIERDLLGLARNTKRPLN